MVGAFFLHDLVGGDDGAGALGEVLEERLVVLLVLVLEDLVHLDLEGVEHERPGLLEAAVEVERGDDGLEGVGEDRLGEAALLLEAAPEDDEAFELQLLGLVGERGGRDDDRLHGREVAFLVPGKELVEVLADDVAEDGVAQELEALVAGQVLVLRRAVVSAWMAIFGLAKAWRSFPSRCRRISTSPGSVRSMRSPSLNSTRPRDGGLPVIPGIPLIRGIRGKRAASPRALLS